MAAEDTFREHAGGITGSANDGFDVTPHNTNELAYVTRAISCAVAGNIAMVTAGGSEVAPYLAAGVLHPIRAKIIKAADTTATGIVGWY